MDTAWRVYSARKIQQRLTEDVAFRVLAAGNEPDFRTIAAFDNAKFGLLKVSNVSALNNRLPASPSFLIAKFLSKAKSMCFITRSE
jgi:hypothetical protein